MNLYKYPAALLLTLFLFASCSETRKKAAEKMDELNAQADELNAAVNDGLQKVESLDSAVRSGAAKLKEYDSLVLEGSSKIDSIAKEKTKAWEELTSY